MSSDPQVVVPNRQSSPIQIRSYPAIFGARFLRQGQDWNQSGKLAQRFQLLLPLLAAFSAVEQLAVRNHTHRSITRSELSKSRQHLRRLFLTDVNANVRI
jgi:hypothetical protein